MGDDLRGDRPTAGAVDRRRAGLSGAGGAAGHSRYVGRLSRALP